MVAAPEPLKPGTLQLMLRLWAAIKTFYTYPEYTRACPISQSWARRASVRRGIIYEEKDSETENILRHHNLYQAIFQPLVPS